MNPLFGEKIVSTSHPLLTTAFVHGDGIVYVQDIPDFLGNKIWLTNHNQIGQRFSFDKHQGQIGFYVERQNQKYAACYRSGLDAHMEFADSPEEALVNLGAELHTKCGFAIKTEAEWMASETNKSMTQHIILKPYAEKIGYIQADIEFVSVDHKEYWARSFIAATKTQQQTHFACVGPKTEKAFVVCYEYDRIDPAGEYHITNNLDTLAAFGTYQEARQYADFAKSIFAKRRAHGSYTDLQNERVEIVALDWK